MESPSRRMIVRGGVSAGALLAVFVMAAVVLPGFLNPPDREEVEEFLNVAILSDMIDFKMDVAEACETIDVNELLVVNNLVAASLDVSDISVLSISEVADHLNSDEDLFEILPYMEEYLEAEERASQCIEGMIQEAEAIHGEGSVIRTAWSDPGDHPALAVVP